MTNSLSVVDKTADAYGLKDLRSVTSELVCDFDKPSDDNKASNAPSLFQEQREYVITYKDNRGVKSERQILFLSHRVNKTGDAIAYARCKKTNATRSFIMDKIMEAVDAETGELIIDAITLP